MKHIVTILSVVCISLSCPKHEIIEEKYPNGSLMSRTTMLNGVKDGIFLNCMASGDTIEFGNYSKGLKEGVFLKKMPGAESISLFTTYKNDIPDGPTAFVNNNNDTIILLSMENGKRTGLCKFFNPTTQMKIECEFIDGKAINGIWTESSLMPMPVPDQYQMPLFQYVNGNATPYTKD